MRTFYGSTPNVCIFISCLGGLRDSLLVWPHALLCSPTTGYHRHPRSHRKQRREMHVAGAFSDPATIGRPVHLGRGSQIFCELRSSMNWNAGHGQVVAQTPDKNVAHSSFNQSAQHSFPVRPFGWRPISLTTSIYLSAFSVDIFG